MEIKKLQVRITLFPATIPDSLQPYVDLVHGDSTPERSLLLDYTRTKCIITLRHDSLQVLTGFSSNFIVWTNAASNKHYLVALASLMVLLSFAFQPLAAALLVVKDTYWQEPGMLRVFASIFGFHSRWLLCYHRCYPQQLGCTWFEPKCTV